MRQDDIPTIDAADVLETTPNNLIAGIRNRRFPAPKKDRWGRYLWSPADIALAREGLSHRRKNRQVEPAAV